MNDFPKYKYEIFFYIETIQLSETIIDLPRLNLVYQNWVAGCLA